MAIAMQSRFSRLKSVFLPAMLLVAWPWHEASPEPAPLLCEPAGTTADHPDDVPVRVHGFEEAPDQLEDGWSASTLTDAGFSIEPFREMVRDIEEGLYKNIDSVLVARHGKLVFEAYFNGFDSTTKHQTRSAFKSITSTLAGIAIDRDLIPGVDVPISRFFPEHWPDIAGDRRLKDGITLSHMLSMTPGFDAEEAFGVGPWREDELWRADDWVRFALDLPMAEPPGQQFRYSSSTSFLIGVIVAQAAGKPLPRFAKETLFQPLGISDYCWTLTPKGHAVGMGSFYMLPRDMLKVGQMFLNRGTWNETRIVSEAWVREATQPLVEAVPPGTPSDSSSFSGYGFQWWTHTARSFEDPRVQYFLASGNGGQEIFVFPKLDMVVVFTGSNYSKPIGHRQPLQILNRSILYSLL